MRHSPSSTSASSTSWGRTTLWRIVSVDRPSPAGTAWMDISSHGDAEGTKEAKRIIQMEKAMEQEGVKCFVSTANLTDLAKFWGARIQAIREKTLEQWMVAPVELVRSVLTEDWSDDYAASQHWSKYWNAVSAPSDDEWPEGLTEDGDKLFLKDKLLVPENWSPPSSALTHTATTKTPWITTNPSDHNRFGAPKAHQDRSPPPTPTLQGTLPSITPTSPL